MFQDDEYFYAQVVEEISRGQIRKGLWAKALAATKYDKNEAKALYIRMRLKTLKKTVTVEARQAALVAEEPARQENEHVRLEGLDVEKEELASLARTRKAIRSWGFVVGVVGSIVWAHSASVLPASGDEWVFALIVATWGALGYSVANLLRVLSPKQRYLNKVTCMIEKEPETLRVNSAEEAMWIIRALRINK